MKVAIAKDFEKELATKYRQLLSAKQKVMVNPDGRGVQWKYAQLEMAYQDTMVKSKLPREKIQAIETDVKEEHDKEVSQSNQLKQAYKKDILQQLQPTKEEKNYKDSYKQHVLESLEKQPNEKEEAPEESQKRKQEMEAFEQKQGYEKVYELKREVLDEIKDMDLTPVQKEKLGQIETDLEKEKEMKLGKTNTQNQEHDMEM